VNTPAGAISPAVAEVNAIAWFELPSASFAPFSSNN
jgi:hypothetical protein